MAYKSLYRKYRPSKFEDVYGQNFIIKTLNNAIENNITLFSSLDTVRAVLDVLEEITLTISTIDS